MRELAGVGRVRVSMFVSPGPYFDIRELAEQTMTLYDLLLELDGVEAVRHAHVPAETKPVDAWAMGSLLVTLAPAALPAAIELVRRWLVGRSVSSVRVVLDGDLIEVGKASRPRVEAFLRRHGG